MTAAAIFQHVIVWLPMLVAGIFLMRWAWRGRRVNDHPICRKCRFDLVGLAPDGSRPDRCPECGMALVGTTRRARRAVIDGERKRRWRAFVLGLLLLLAALGTGFWLTYKPLAKFPWTTWAPDWVLAEMVDSPNAVRADMVVRELLQRLQRDNLSISAVRRATTKILVLQADLNSPWRPVLGTLVEASRAKEILSDELWQAYAANAIVINVNVSPVIGAGSKVYYDATATARVGSPITRPRSPLISLGALVQQRRQTLGSESRSREFGRHNLSNLHHQPSAGSGGLFDLVSPGAGEHAGTIEFDVWVYNSEDTDQDHEPTSFVSQRTVTVPFTLSVIDPSNYAVSQKSPTELRDLMRKSFAIEAITLARRSESNAMNLRVRVMRPPMDYAFAVVMRTPSGDVHLGQMSARAESNVISMIPVERPPAGLSAGDVATIVIKPDIAAARAKPEIREIWGEEIILENVPIALEAE